MGENNESDNKILEELAVVTDKIQTILPKSKSTIIFEMDDYEFARTKRTFSIFDNNIKRFKIDISDIEIVFLSENVFFEEKNEPEVEEPKVEEPKPEKISWFRKLFPTRK
jgi:hypothetical protein